MVRSSEFDFIVVGAGIAGASAAAWLSREGRVAVVEAEHHAGVHSTGRSAALFSELYGNAVIRGLTRASRTFFFAPPSGFASVPLVTLRETLYFARPDQMDALAAFYAKPDIAAGTRALSLAQAQARLPVFKPGYLGGAVVESGSADIDVDALHQGFLRQARGNGAVVLFGEGIESMQRVDRQWQVNTIRTTVRSPIVVNAAGASGDQIARLAGVTPVGLQPRRRTALLIDVPEAHAATAASWPAAIDIDEQLHFKPDAGLLLLSPADEHSSAPRDIQPEDLVVADAVDRFERATDTSVRRVRRRWADVRVFAPDRSPVVGFDPAAPGFFWLVGQGTCDIQTAPALGRVAALLVAGRPLPDDVCDKGVTQAMLSKSRFLA